MKNELKNKINNNEGAVLTNKNSILNNDMDSIEKNMKMKKSNYLTEEQPKCPECGSLELREDHEIAEISCAKCGIVIEENLMDMGLERIAYDKEQVNSRVRTGPAMTGRSHDKGLNTMI